MNSLPTLEHEIELWKKGYIVIGIDEVGRGAFAGPLFVGGVIFTPTTNYPSTSSTGLPSIGLRTSRTSPLRASERIKHLESLGINDSKKLRPNERKTLSKIIQNESLVCHISAVSVSTINRIGIGKATFLAMRDVVKNLREKVQLSVLGRQLSVISSSVVSSSVLRPKDRKPKNQIPKTENREQITEKVFVLVDGFYIKYLNGIGLKNQKGIIRGDEISLSIAAASIIAKATRDRHMRKLSAKFPVYGWGRNKGYGTNFHREALSKFGPTRLHRTDFIKNFI